ncbi:ComEA family DNA-binding protein [Pararhodonellum marinum]|uniref:ComEA family DNA-binding protein n=1 Tax=Pararhodonellum marinum TaxID=2755358 RepID=UPI00188FA0D0|nr:helix-hairpin-helix domain-containing protein [Pararhodonellum marinum]
MKSRVTLIAILFFGLVHAAQTQQIRKGDIDMEAFMEELFSQGEMDVDYEDLFESLLQVLLNPIHLNKANEEALQSLYILSPMQVNEILKHRAKFGDFLSIYELQAVPEMDLPTIYKLIPFVTLEDGENKSTTPLLTRILEEKDGYLIARHRRFWEERRGFTPPDTLSGGRISSRYLGDPNDLYVRFRIQHARDFSLGFTLDKDAGEQFIWDPRTKRYGFNFFSYHFTLYNQGKWKAITLGDYQMQFGQGLVFGAGFSVGKGAETITTVRRSSIGLRPFTSAMEFGFFRGVSATYETGRFSTTLMLSDAPRDGNVQLAQDTLSQEEAFISTLLLSGLHRTPTEISYKNQIRERNLGANIHYKSRDRNLQWGINSLFTQFSQPLIRQQRIYNTHEFAGRENHLHSLYFTYNFQNYFFFGESAISQSGGTANILGMMASLNSHINLAVLWRDYEKNFHSFSGNAFAEGSRPINEKGLYLGLQVRPTSKWTWSGYYDRFSFPWMRYRVYRPSSGREWLQRLHFRPNKTINAFVQYRDESKDRNLSASEQVSNTYLLSTGRRRNYVINLDYAISRRWSIKSRVQGSSFGFNGVKTRGYTLLQDINMDLGNWRWSTRFALFDTDDYDNRQFVYEKNVLWAFGFPQYYGQGIRFYFLTQYRVNPKLILYARWARTTYTDRDEIGSGLQQVQGNKLSETTLQVKYQFNR